MTAESTQPMTPVETDKLNIASLLQDAYCSGYMRGHEDITTGLGYDSKLGCDEYMIRYGRGIVEKIEALISPAS